jgi:FkbM family methyltransferase
MIRELLKFLAAIYKRLKLLWWNLAIDYRKVLTLEVLKDVYIKFRGDGDIAKILFSDQHLVRYQKSFEYRTLSLYQSFLKEGDVIIDVGANIGLFSLLGAKYIGDHGWVHAFEPTRSTFKILEENIQLNMLKNIVPHQVPLADGIKPIVMINPMKNNDKYYDAFNRIQEVEADEPNDYIQYTKTFDEFVGENKLTRIDLVKVDIEGAELLFFKGAEQSLLKFKPKIIFEANENHCQAFNYKVIDVLIYIKELGYSLRQLNEEQWLAT